MAADNRCTGVQVKVVQEPVQGGQGTTFMFQVNGWNIFAKGAIRAQH